MWSSYIFLSVLSLFGICCGNKYSAKMNTPDYQNLVNLDKPFRMQKLNLVWEKAVKKLSEDKLKQFYTDLKFQDKEELAWKKNKANGLDKKGLKESTIIASFKAVLEKYGLEKDFQALHHSTNQGSVPEISSDAYIKSVFRDKKLNKLWLKAEKQGFNEDELKTLKEEFQHHQNKIDQYYSIINKLHDKSSDDKLDNAVENVLNAEVGDKVWKSENPHQMLKEKHSELKVGYDYLNGRIFPSVKATEFEEPQVNALWEMAKNASFSDQELESLRGELHHFEHRVQKLKILSTENAEHDVSNVIPEVLAKQNKKLKEYEHKVGKIQKELTNLILERHSEL